MIFNIVGTSLQGKTAKPGTQPYEVLSFDSHDDYAEANDEKDFKKSIVAKFSTYGDATLYAHNLENSQTPPAVIVIRA